MHKKYQVVQNKFTPIFTSKIPQFFPDKILSTDPSNRKSLREYNGKLIQKRYIFLAKQQNPEFEVVEQNLKLLKPIEITFPYQITKKRNQNFPLRKHIRSFSPTQRKLESKSQMRQQHTISPIDSSLRLNNINRIYSQTITLKKPHDTTKHQLKSYSHKNVRHDYVLSGLSISLRDMKKLKT